MADDPANPTHPPCPKCNSRDVVPVVLGLYDEAGLEALRREYGDGGFVLGGCSPVDWDWCCKACGEMFPDPAPTAFSDANEKITYQQWAERQRKIIDQMKAEGTLPTFEEFEKAMAEVREEYRPKILAARAEQDRKGNGDDDCGGHQ